MTMYRIRRASHLWTDSPDNPPCDEAVFDGNCWTVQIDNLESFIFAHDERVIISPSYEEDIHPVITFYDDYVE